jgi:hypothetical protein
MNVMRLARKWWYLVLPMLLLTAGLALLVAQSVPVTYEAKGAILFEPPVDTPADPTQTTTPDQITNRITASGSGEVFAARLMVTVMDNHTVHEELKAKGAADFTVTQGDNTLPLLDIEAEGDTPQKALDTLHLVAQEMDQELLAQQQASQVNQKALITVRPLLPTDKADPLYGGRIRAGLAVGALGVAAALSIPFVMEGVSRSRRRKQESWEDQFFNDVPLAPHPEDRPPARVSDFRS